MQRTLGIVSTTVACSAAFAVTGLCLGGFWGEHVAHAATLADGLSWLFQGAVAGAVFGAALAFAGCAKFGKRLRLARVSGTVILLGALIAGATYMIVNRWDW